MYVVVCAFVHLIRVIHQSIDQAEMLDGHLFPFTLGVACMFGCVVFLGWFGSSPVLLGKESTPTSTWTSTSPR